MISAIVLAAGKSTRMGDMKLLLPLKGKPLLQYVVEAAEASDVDEIIIVLGYRAGDIHAMLHCLPLTRTRQVFNEDFEEGMASSLRVGVSAVDTKAEAAVVILGDMPLFTPEIINRLIQGYHESHAKLVLPTYRGRRGHPVLFQRELFQRLLTLTGDKGGKEVVEEYLDSAQLIHVKDSTVLLDIDTPEDLKRAERRIRGTRSKIHGYRK